MLKNQQPVFGSTRTIDICRPNNLREASGTHEEAEKRSFFSLNDLNFLTPFDHRSKDDLADHIVNSNKSSDVVMDEFMEPKIASNGYGFGLENKISSLSKKKNRDIKTIVNKIQKVRKYIDCIFVRLFYVSVSLIRLSVASCIYDEALLGLLYVSNAIIIVDLVYSLLRRDGLDYYW